MSLIGRWQSSLFKSVVYRLLMDHYDYRQGKVKQKYKSVFVLILQETEAYVVEILFLTDLQDSACYTKWKKMLYTFHLDRSSFLFLV